MDEEEAYRHARRRVRSIKAFYLNCLIFAGVMILLFAINLATAGPWWVQWPLLGLSLGLAAHAVAVFGVSGWLGGDWEERKIRELMARKPEH
ncbi:MAG: 2TM domain-containing protein [Roseiarcus sp.]|jgi:hypothetical protein